MGSLAFPLAMYNNARARDIEALVGDVLIRARMWFITMESDKQISSRTTDGRERWLSMMTDKSDNINKRLARLTLLTSYTIFARADRDSADRQNAEFAVGLSLINVAVGNSSQHVVAIS